MKQVLIIQLMVVLFSVTVTATAQSGKKQKDVNMFAYSELTRLTSWYRQWPVQINLHFKHQATPVMSAQDSAETDIILYCSKHDYYMQAEGMEQIINDSVLVLVNNEAHMIRVYPNNGQLTSNRVGAINSLMPDTSMEKLAKQYLATMIAEDAAVKRIMLHSRAHISETGLEKEIINITYKPGNYQPLTYKHMKRSLVPVDSLSYKRLEEDITWKNRLVTAKSKIGRDLFFVVKESVSECRFISIDYEQKTSPVQEFNRVVKTANGEYQPAKGFEQYNVSQE